MDNLILPKLGDGEILTNHRYIGTISAEDHQNDRPPPLYIRRRPDMIKQLGLHIKMVFDNAEIDNAIIPDAPFTFLKRITLQGLRGETIKDVTGQQLSVLNQFEFGTAALNTMLPIIQPGVYLFEADLIIPLENHTGIFPEETILNTNEFTEMLLEITFGDYRDLYGVPPSVSFEVEVYSLERRKINTDDELHPRKKMMDFDQRLPIVGSQAQRRLPENALIKTIMVTIIGGNGESGRQDNILEYLRIVDDDEANVYVSLSAEEIKSFNKSYYGIEKSNPLAAEQQAGVYIVEFDQLRDLSSLYNTTGKLFPKIILDFVDDPAEWPGVYYGIFIRHVGTPPTILKI